ncbi:MAG: ComEC/Rec2 family competence protein [Kiritimatiellia bacterium]
MTGITRAPPGRHPLVAVCLAFVVGTWVGLAHRETLAPCIVAIAVSLLAWAACRLAARQRRHWRRAASAALLASVGFSACVSGQLAAQKDFEAIERFREIEESREDAVIRGRVIDAPTITVLTPGSARARFRVSVKTLPHEAGEIRMHDAIVRVDWYGPERMVHNMQSFRLPAAGEGWQLNGRIREIERRRGPPLVILQIRGRSPATQRRESMDASPVAMKLWEMRGYAEKILSLGMAEHRESTGLVKAMTLGLTSDVPREVMELFRMSGTVHVFSISGLHVNIVSTIMLTGLTALPIRFRYRVFVFGPMIVAYTIATGAAPSAIRACLMALFFHSAPLVGRPRDSLSSVSAAALILLANNPRELLDLGFIFSFICTAGILLMVPIFTDAAGRAAAWMQARREAARACKPPLDLEDALLQARRPNRLARGLKKVFSKGVNMTRDSLCVSLAAWIASTPVTAVCFGNIVPASLLANLLVVPLSTIMIVTAAMSLVAGIFSPWLAETFNHANLVFAHCLVRSASIFANLPLASFPSGQWTPFHVALWYAAALALFLRLRVFLDSPKNTP